jgi:hypothetical protein
MPVSYQLDKLRTLILTKNSLSGQLPDGLASLTDLQNLHLGKNNFSTTLPAAWAGINKLQTLTLYEGGRVTGSFPDEWSSWGLERINLRGNKLSGPLPERLPANITRYMSCHVI